MALTKVPSNLDATVATTQSASDNSTNVATTAYVTTAISNLSDSAPAALNTLNEIAAALGDDANYASTTTAAIAAKLPLAGGTVTGDTRFNTLVGINKAVNSSVGLSVGSDASSSTSYGLEVCNAGSNTRFLVDGSGSQRFYGSDNAETARFTDGKLGIGLTAPASHLHVRGTTNKTIIADSTFSSGSFTSLAFQRNGTDKWRVAQQHDDSHLSFYNDQTSTYQLSLKSDGKVGIGTHAPVSGLEIRETHTASVADAASMVAGTSLTINGNSGEGSDVLRVFAMADGTGNYGMEVSNSGGNAQYDLCINPINKGFVGIGTNAPQRPLHVWENGSDKAVMRVTNNGNHVAGIELYSGHGNWAIHNSDTVGDALEFRDDSAGQTRMMINSTGKVFITNGTPAHTTSAAYHPLCVITGASNGDVTANGSFVHVGGPDGGYSNTDGYIQGLSLGYHENNAYYKHTAIGVRAHSDGAARRSMVFLVNTATEAASAALGDAKLTISGTNGVVSGDLNDTSDIGFKENIADLPSTLDIVKQLKPRTFSWKDRHAARGDSVGFIAQEIQSVVDGNTLVQGEAFDPNGIPGPGLSLNTIGIVAYLTKAIQEQQTIIEDLKGRIETLEG